MPSSKKKNGRIPGYRKHATGQAFVRLNGRNVYLGKHATTESRQEYERVIGEWQTTQRTAVPAPRSRPKQDDGITVDQLLAEFFAVRVPQKYYRDGKPTKHVDSLKEALPELRALYGQTPVGSFGSRAMEEVKSEMIRRRESISQTTIAKRLVIIRTIFRWGVGMELVKPEVLVKLTSSGSIAEGDVRVRAPKDVKPVDENVVWETLRFASRQVRHRNLRVLGGEATKISFRN